LAVQIPRNFGAPSHTSITETARSGRGAQKLEPLLRPSPVAEPPFYYDLLAPRAAALDIWETEYLQVLEGENPVKEWTKGTWLSPAAGGARRARAQPLRGGLRRAGRAAYPPRATARRCSRSAACS
jgi:trans-aconitate 2-methyltransferase